MRHEAPDRRTISHRGFMLSRAASTLLAHHHRTGADLERWFGQWKPPDPKWWLPDGLPDQRARPVAPRAML